MVPKAKKTLLAWASAIVVLAAVSAAAWLWIPGLRPQGLSFAHTWPGRAKEGYSASRSAVANLSEGAARLLESGPEGTWTSWHRLAGRNGTPPAISSGRVETGDQALLLLHAAETDDRAGFMKMFQFLEERRTGPDNRLLSADGGTAGNLESLCMLRAMAEGYSRWGGRELSDAIRRYSDGLLETSGLTGIPADTDLLLPGPSPTPASLTTPTPGPTAAATSIPSSTVPQFRPYVRLAGADFYTMELLAAVDIRWQKASELCLDAASSAFVSPTLPLYRAGIDPANGSVVPYASSTPAIDTMDSLLVILHLCEVGEQRAESIAWIRQKLFNDGMLHASYSIVTGESDGLAENPAIYGVIARIARILEDEDFYKLAADRLAWHMADLRTSPAYGTVFRDTEDGLVEVRAADNAWALLGLE